MVGLRWLVLTATAVLAITAAGGESIAADQEAAGCSCVGQVGNVNCDYLDQVNIADLIFLIDHLFLRHTRLPNVEEANCDGDPEGRISLGDIAALIDHLFLTGRELADCPKPPNNPPETRIVGYLQGIPFINGISPARPGTGVSMRWRGLDLVDHPYYPPPFEFEYRLFGPYSDSVLDILQDSFVVPVFRTRDHKIYRQGDSSVIVVCDTSYDSGRQEITCDSVLLDTIVANNYLGILDTLIRFEDEDFLTNPELNRLAIQSEDDGDEWTFDTTGSLFDVFAAAPCDTTRQSNFIFWVRSRDPIDPAIIDPTPAYASLEVIDPRFERDIMVFDWTNTANQNRGYQDTARAYWERTINGWAARTGHTSVVFDTVPDHGYGFVPTDVSGFIKRLLNHKVAVMIQDACVTGGWAAQEAKRMDTYQAMNCGVNVWVAARVPSGSYIFGSSTRTSVPRPGSEYWMGFTSYRFSGWGYYYIFLGGQRVEDFIGAYSEYPSLWPDLVIDSALLHRRYRWDGPPWRPDLAALPEVGWMQPVPEAEIMYTYRSLYGHDHFIDLIDFEGLPVMHRLDRGLFRSAQSLFTPMAFEESAMEQMLDTMLNWLYDGFTGLSPSTPTSLRPALSADEMRRQMSEAIEEETGAQPVTDRDFGYGREY